MNECKEHKFSSVCDGCKEPPSAFEMGNDDGSTVQVFYHVVDTETNDPTALMSDGTVLWRAWEKIEHPTCGHQRFLCVKCFDQEYSHLMEDADEDQDLSTGSD